MPVATPRAMFRILSFDYYSRLGNVMSGFTYVYIICMSFSASNIIVTVVVPRVCVCVSVRSFLPPRASRPRNIGTYVFTATRRTLIYVL